MAGTCFLYGNGGGNDGINIEVVGGTTQPTGKENLVWVNTSVKITSWVVSPDEPQATAGMVWIRNGYQNKTNILKKNVVEVYPSNCAQYIDDEWKVMDAYIYNASNGWVQFSPAIIDIIRNGAWWIEKNYTVTRTQATVDLDNGIYVGEQSNQGWFTLTTYIDMRQYTKMKIRGYRTNPYNSRDFYVASTLTNPHQHQLASITIETTPSPAEYILDVSNIDGGYLGFGYWNNFITITDIILCN